MSGLSNENSQDFQKRLKRIDKSVRKGNRAKVVPRTGVTDYNEELRRKARKKTFKWSAVFKTLLLIWVLFTGLKAFMSAQMGRTAYEARIMELRAGTSAERLASFTLERGAVMNMIYRIRKTASAAQQGQDSKQAPSGDAAAPAENQSSVSN